MYKNCTVKYKLGHKINKSFPIKQGGLRVGGIIDFIFRGKERYDHHLVNQYTSEQCRERNNNYQ